MSAQPQPQQISPSSQSSIQLPQLVLSPQLPSQSPPLLSTQYLNTPYQAPQDQIADGQFAPPVPEKQPQFTQTAFNASPVVWDRVPKSAGTDGSSQKTGLTGESILSRANSWTYEMLSMLFAIGAVGSITGVLAYYDGKSLPSWPSSITLNAIIAILATIATASMSVPLSSGLGQLKWIRFRQNRTPLSDMELFDDASRGALGALALLLRARGGIAGSFGCTIMVIALLLNPFAQQIATYPVRTVSTPQGAVNFRALKYGPALSGNSDAAPFVPILPLKAAVYNGMFAENGKPWMSLPFTCQTGDCDWDPIETLAVCYKCIDMSEYLSRFCSNGTARGGSTSGCGWTLPSGARLSTSAEVFGMTSLFPGSMGGASYSTIMKLTFMGTEAQAGKAGEIQPWARQCTLSACVQTIQSSVRNGNLNETILSQTTNDTVPGDGGASLISNGQPQPIVITSNTTGTSYNMTANAMLGIQSWFTTLFRNGTASRSSSVTNRTMTNLPGSPIVVNLTVGISSGVTFFDTDMVQAFYWNYYEYANGLDMLMSDLAVSMSASFRAISGQQVNGTSLTNESYVHVRWGFVAVPVLAVLLATVFLFVAIHRTWTSGARAWKTSALAMLFHGLDEGARGKFDELDSLAAKKREAKGIQVKLDAAQGGGGTLKLDRVYQ
ncbi:hypothetical protein B0T24DRAFT_524142 [Lasiosphaeria ovina]|uniref:Uncharacterized protein n=1 Tax=Lasiosphaeria ovina TaxID=92902 RepID=A0AAE0KG60_9PEZI|nr:hypothetical protein B0T24DRAFT_524142 [Lasiosphaeria ovina]